MADVDRLSWVSNPDQRGTLQIFWGCFATLALCVWTAVHPNIQWRPPRWRNDLAARLLMMATAIVFPEVLISAAWKQQDEASHLRKEIAAMIRRDPRELRNDSLAASDNAATRDAHDENRDSRLMDGTSRSSSPVKLTQTPWTNKQAFFAVMGGFVIEKTFVDPTGKPQRLRYAMTAEGIKCLFLVGAAPRINLEEIEERDNADYIAKSIVIGQVLWFAVQIVTRLGQRLPVTALEVHTVVHVGCALLMYMIWWHKPYNLTKPIVLSDSISCAIAAAYICREVAIRIHEKAMSDYEDLLSKYWRKRALAPADERYVEDHGAPPERPERSPTEDLLDKFVDFNSGPIPDSGWTEDECILSSLAREAKKGIQILRTRSRGDLVFDNDFPPGIRQNTENFTIRQVWGAWSSDTGHRMSKAKLLHFAFNLLYGGAHLAAWNSHSFPTTAELWLWRASSIMIAAVWLWGTIWILFWRAARSNSRWLSSVRNGDLEIVFGPLFWIIIAAFVLARCYLFVESLVSLRSLPEGAYVEVRWTALLPHSN